MEVSLISFAKEMTALTRLIFIFAIVSSLFLGDESFAKKKKAEEKTTLPPPATSEIKMGIEEGSTADFLKWIRSQEATFHTKQIFFFDTPDLGLFAKGILFRVRRGEDQTFDSVVKWRRKEAEPFSKPNAKTLRAISCEWDVVSEKEKWLSCALSHQSKKILKSIESESVGEFLESNQKKLAKSLGEQMNFSDIKSLGRINSSEWEFSVGEWVSTCSLWELPGQARALECSVRVPVEKESEARQSLQKKLSEAGLRIKADGQLKTEWFLHKLTEKSAR